MNAYLRTLTRAQLERLAQRIYDRMSAGGGTCYGIDDRTMRITHPHLRMAYGATMTELVRRYDAINAARVAYERQGR